MRKAGSLRVVLLLGSLLGSLSAGGVACSGGDSSPSTGSTTASSPPSAPAPAAEPAPTPAEPPTPVAEPEPESGEVLVARGRGVYNSNCIACHSTDPNQDGALGPAIAGASPELLEARVLRGEYPAGYTPKRDTNAMIPLPHLENEIAALAAYLADAAS